jgi:hypothetical protein
VRVTDAPEQAVVTESIAAIHLEQLRQARRYRICLSRGREIAKLTAPVIENDGNF